LLARKLVFDKKRSRRTKQRKHGVPPRGG